MTIISFVFVVTLLVGCSNDGSKNPDKDVDKDPKININDKTKVNNLSESFIKYSEIKGEKMEMLTKMSEKADNYLLAMSLIPIGMSDLTIIPASVCGLKEVEAVQQLFLFKNVTYDLDGDKCTVTYNDEEETTSKFVAVYDEKTDSATMNVYENDVHTMTSEYIKIKDGYATQFYVIEEDTDKVTVYKTLFEKNNVYTSVFEDVGKPESIFKKPNITSDFAKNGNYLYLEVIDGIATGTIEGEPINFNMTTE